MIFPRHCSGWQRSVSVKLSRAKWSMESSVWTIESYQVVKTTPRRGTHETYFSIWRNRIIRPFIRQTKSKVLAWHRRGKCCGGMWKASGRQTLSCDGNISIGRQNISFICSIWSFFGKQNAFFKFSDRLIKKNQNRKTFQKSLKGFKEKKDGEGRSFLRKFFLRLTGTLIHLRH